MDKCIICFEKNNLIKICNCNYYVHQQCFDNWYQLNTNNCFMCKDKINISYKTKFIKYFNQLITEINNFCVFLSEYNLEHFIRWDDYD